MVGDDLLDACAVLRADLDVARRTSSTPERPVYVRLFMEFRLMPAEHALRKERLDDLPDCHRSSPLDRVGNADASHGHNLKNPKVPIAVRRQSGD